MCELVTSRELRGAVGLVTDRAALPERTDRAPPVCWLGWRGRLQPPVAMSFDDDNRDAPFASPIPLKNSNQMSHISASAAMNHFAWQATANEITARLKTEPNDPRRRRGEDIKRRLLTYGFHYESLTSKRDIDAAGAEAVFKATGRRPPLPELPPERVGRSDYTLQELKGLLGRAIVDANGWLGGGA